ncbi:hypothetical protein J4H86_11220 [Spiractinospora alimapuensis]|uniref:hypothetical protein n=1 Tax=Spiractinospora alimapuensis TaxID=2820884 RepID=UPI001F364411|nr:hypothetical protein [Spiractinospora alimapuensis]QVQ55195.1 hypothetical protein J4H86_11220 [Spiractinospora alimapuensis]
MFSLLWRILPGPAFVKFVLMLGIIGAAGYGLWFHAFPWVDPYLPFNDVTVEAEGGGVPDETVPEGEDAPVMGEDGEGGDEEGIVGVDIPIGDETPEE